MTDAGISLRDGLDLAGLSIADLWLRYIALGGNTNAAQLARHITGQDRPGHYEHNLIAQSINESFTERGEDHPVGYRDVYPGKTPDGEDSGSP